MSAPRGLHLHFDPVSGIAGDMTVGALVDAGVPRRVVSAAIAAVGVPGLRAGFAKRRRGAYAGTAFLVRWPGMRDHGRDHRHDHRNYAEIHRLLRRSSLDSATRKLAERIFERLAVVEAKLHGVAVERVAFHEVGAYDSIADIVGAAAALAHLEPSGVTSAPPALGQGSIHTAHGLLSVPAPATAALLRGFPAKAEGHGELTTPTGAAILTTVAGAFAPPPPQRLRAQGLGAGTRDLSDRPNLLRVLLGEPLGLPQAAPPGDTLLVEANIDDMSPQLVEPLLAALLRAGALDAWVTPILMKKGRPAVAVSALVAPSAVGAVERAFFDHSTTLGVRKAPIARTVLGRSLMRVATRFGPVAVKVSGIDGRVVGASPEFDDCRRLAAKTGVPVREVLAEAAAEARRWLLARAEPARRG